MYFVERSAYLLYVEASKVPRLSADLCHLYYYKHEVVQDLCMRPYHELRSAVVTV